jgi:hypothetical protein
VRHKRVAPDTRVFQHLAEFNNRPKLNGYSSEPLPRIAGGMDHIFILLLHEGALRMASEDSLVMLTLRSVAEAESQS